jgi:hypothetical protein
MDRAIAGTGGSAPVTFLLTRVKKGTALRGVKKAGSKVRVVLFKFKGK